MNGDSYDDMIVGAPNNDAGGGWAGKAYIYTVKGVVPYQFNLYLIQIAVVVVALVSVLIVVLYRRTRYQKKKNT